MSRYSPIDDETLDAIANLGFAVYQPTTGQKTYLYYTDGTRIGYLQKGDFGGLSISTVHIPNRTTGTGFQATDAADPALVLTRSELERGFMHAPSWASSDDRKATHKWADMAAFLKSRGNIVPLEMVREAK